MPSWTSSLPPAPPFTPMVSSAGAQMEEHLLCCCCHTYWLRCFHDHIISCRGRLTSFYETAVPELEKAVKKRNFDDKRSAHSAFFLLDKKVKASHIENCKVLINDWPDEFWKLSRTFRQASWGLVEETVPLLSQDGGYGSHAAASHVFTADPGGVRHPHQHAINRHLRRIWVVHKDINTTIFFLPAGEKICKRLQKSFYNILHLF